MPFFSVIIPTYNRAHMLGKAIKSVLDQTFEDWELIIVDDGSTDNTKSLVYSYKDARIKYIYQENAERSAARNKGIENAKGEYICFLDSDDYFLKNRLENFFHFIIKKKLGKTLLFSGIKFQTQDEINELTVIIPKKKENIFDYVSKNLIGIPQVCAPIEIFKKHRFNENFTNGEDWELWLRIIEENNLLFIPNNATIVACIHENRSVNVIKNNCAFDQRKTIRFALKKPHPGNKISKKIKREVLSNSYFNSAKYFMYNRKKMHAIFEIFKALINCPIHNQTKHRIYCLFNLFQGKIPKDYFLP